MSGQWTRPQALLEVTKLSFSAIVSVVLLKPQVTLEAHHETIVMTLARF